MTNDPIIYQDTPGWRVLDLRPLGVDCIPLLGLSNFQKIRPGTDYHVHPEGIEISLCMRGNLAFETDERTYPFLPGSIFVSTPQEPHRMRHNPKGLMLYRLLFSRPRRGRRILGLDALESEWLVRSLWHLPKRLFKSTPRIKEDFRALFATYDAKQLASARRTKLKALVLDLLVAIVEAARLLPPKVPDRIAALMCRMHEHPEQDYPLNDLKRAASLSAAGFSETFKRAAGLPPHAYLIGCRIEKARNLLLQSTSSLQSIADLLRFSSPQHFSNVFKRLVGQSPAAFRKAHGLIDKIGNRRSLARHE